MNSLLRVQIEVVAQNAVKTLNQVSSAVTNVGLAGTKSGGGLTSFFSSMNSMASTAKAAIAKASDEMVKWGKNLQWTGRQLTTAFTLPIAAVAAIGIKTALANSTATEQLRKAYGDLGMSAGQVASDLTKLDVAFEALSNIFGVAKAQVIDVAAAWAQAGATGVTLAKAVRATLEAATLDHGDLKETTTQLIGIGQAWNLTGTQMQQTIAMVNAASDQSKVSVGDYLNVLNQLGGIARTAGVDQQHLVALVGAITPAAGDANGALTGLRQIITRLLAPTKASIEAMHLMGVEVESTSWQNKNAAQRLEALSAAFEKLTPAQQNLVDLTISSRFAVQRFGVLMDDIANPLGRYHSLLKDTNDETRNAAILTRDIGNILGSSGQQWKILTTQLQNALAQVFLPMLPVLLSVVSHINNLVQSFTRLSPVTQQWVLIGLSALAVLPLLVTYFGAMSTLLGTVGKMFVWAFLGREEEVGALIRPLQALTNGLQYMAEVVASEVATGLRGLVPLLSIVGQYIVFYAEWVAANGAALVAVIGEYLAFYAQWLAANAAAVARFLGEYLAFYAEWVAVPASAIATVIGEYLAFYAQWFAATTAALANVFAENFAFYAAWVTAPAVAIAKVLGEYLAFYAQWIAANARALAAFIGEYLVFYAQWVALHAARLGAVIGEYLAFYAQWIAANAAAVGAVIGEYLAFFAEWIAAQTAALSTQANGTFASLATWVAAHASAIIAVLGAYLGFYAEWVAAQAAALGALLAENAAAMAMWVAATAGAALGVAAPIAAALAAVIAVVALFSPRVRRLLGDLGDWLTSTFAAAWGALPKIVEASLHAVWNVVVALGQAIYKALSYLNPFARHSPSLVDSVQAGVDLIASEYASLGDIGIGFRTAVADLQAFTDATEAARALLDDTRYTKKDRSVVVQYAGEAGGEAADAVEASIMRLQALLVPLTSEYDQQNQVVEQWKNNLDAANAALKDQEDILKSLQATADTSRAALDAAQQALTDLENTPIAGLREAQDAIYQNELAQKRLQLELAQMADKAGMSIDDARSKIAAMQGEIEGLEATVKTLHLEGAGSDVLAPFLGQIGDLQAAQAGLAAPFGGNLGPNGRVAELEAQLKKLQLDGDVLNLTFATTFDPMTRQLEQARQVQQEMPFDELLAKTKEQVAEVARLTDQWKAADEAVKVQQAAVDQLTVSRDAVQASYDAEKQRLSDLKDAYDGITKQIGDMTAALNNFVSLAKQAQPAKQSDLAKQFGEAGTFPQPTGGGFLPSEAGNLQDLANQWLKESQKAFGNLDLFAPLREKFNQFTEFVRHNWIPEVLAGIGAIAGYALGGPVGAAVGAALGAGLGLLFHEAHGTFQRMADDMIQQLGSTKGAVRSWATDFEETVGGVSSKSIPALRTEMDALRAGAELAMNTAKAGGMSSQEAVQIAVTNGQRSKVLADDIAAYEKQKQLAIAQTGTFWEKAAEATGVSVSHIAEEAQRLKEAHDKAAVGVEAAFSGMGVAVQQYGDRLAANRNISAGDLSSIADSVNSLKGTYGGLGPAADAALQRILTSGDRTVAEWQTTAQKAADLRSAVESSFKNSTSVVEAFGSQSTVTGAQIDKFFKDQVTAAQNWSDNLIKLSKSGIDNGLLQEIAQAGPKAAPMLQGLLDDIGKNGVDSINKAQGQEQTILKNTLNLILGADPQFNAAGAGNGTALATGLANTAPASASAAWSHWNMFQHGLGTYENWVGLGQDRGAAFGNGLMQATSIALSAGGGIFSTIGTMLGLLGQLQGAAASGAANPVPYGVSVFAEGGIVTHRQLAVVGEAGPELILPLSRRQRMSELAAQAAAAGYDTSALWGMGGILATLPRMAQGGVVRATPGGTAVVLGEGGQDERVTPMSRYGASKKDGGDTVLHFHGDLSFPNIKNGNDAKEFIANLERLTK